MPSKVELLALSSLLLQSIPSTLAHPARAGFWPWDNEDTSNLLNGFHSSSPAPEASPYPYSVFVAPENGLNELTGGNPDKDKDHCGGGGGKGPGGGGDKGHDGGKLPTVTVNDW